MLAVALATGRHVVLEGPPGTGKSTLLRTLAEAAEVALEFVEGNAELTPGRLVGSFDPAIVLERGYRPDAFLEGPLVAAMRSGGLLYLEELNRVPEETLNVLIVALAEGEVHVPRFGHVVAEPGFRLIAAMNPYDAIGTARVAQAVYDRVCRIAIGYQDAAGERRIVAAESRLDRDTELYDLAVDVARASREHRDVAVGSSVRGAIDLTLLADGLRVARGRPHGDAGEGWGGELPSREILLDAALAALSGRVRLDDGCERTPEEVVTELLDAALARRQQVRRARSEDEPAEAGGGANGGQDGAQDGAPPGKAPAPAGDQQQGGDRLSGGRDTIAQARDRIEQAGAAIARVAEAGRQTFARTLMQATHPDFSAVSPELGSLDEQAFADALDDDPEAGLALLADLVRATDADLRRQARQLAVRLCVQLGRGGRLRASGVGRLGHISGSMDGDLDLDRSLDRTGGQRPRGRDDLVVRAWHAPKRSVCLLVDRSGSMRGAQVLMAAVAAAGVVHAAERQREQVNVSVLSFANEVTVLQGQGQRRPAAALVSDILALRGLGSTDLALALYAAERQLAGAHGTGERVALLLSDSVATTGTDPLRAAAGIDRVHVLGTSDDRQSQEAGRALAARGGGRYVRVDPETVARGQLPAALNRLLA